MHKDNKGEYYIEAKTATKTNQSTTQNTPQQPYILPEDLESPPQKNHGLENKVA